MKKTINILESRFGARLAVAGLNVLVTTREQLRLDGPVTVVSVTIRSMCNVFALDETETAEFSDTTSTRCEMVRFLERVVEQHLPDETPRAEDNLRVSLISKYGDPKGVFGP